MPCTGVLASTSGLAEDSEQSSSYGALESDLGALNSGFYGFTSARSLLALAVVSLLPIYRLHSLFKFFRQIKFRLDFTQLWQ